jgi:hypothetical protein
MLANLSVRCWGAARNDKKISSEVAKTHSVDAKRAGKYRKNAINVEAPTYEAVKAAATELRAKHSEFTLPWSQDGARILTTTMFEQYSREMRTLRTKFDQAVQAFVEDYPTLKVDAKIELNGMYNEADYPADIREKFGVEVGILPLPEAEDFRVSLPETAVRQIKDDIQAEMKRAAHVAMQEPYERLYSHITRMVQRLSDPKAVFRDTLVSGLVDLCAILPGLNLTRDPQLDVLRQRAEQMIAHVSAQELRDNPAVRRDVARQAADIQNMMAGFMGAAASEAA